MAELSLIRAICKPWRTPQIAVGKKRSRQSLERDSARNLSKQNTQGANDSMALTQTVRRDTDPTTKPPVQAQPISRITLHSSRESPGPTGSPVA